MERLIVLPPSQRERTTVARKRVTNRGTWLKPKESFMEEVKGILEIIKEVIEVITEHLD